MPRLASIVIIALTLVTLIAFIGCGGPTKQGLEARSAAADRVDMVNAQVSFDQARRSFETGDLVRALREVNNAIARYDDVAAYHVLKGRVFLEMHRLEAAMRSFTDAMELDAANPEPYYFAGVINQRWSRHEQAYESYLAASKNDVENVQYLLAAAESLIALGRYAEARDVVVSRLSYHEHNAALRHLLGHIAKLEGRPAEAASLLHQAMLLNPDDAMLLEEVAWARFDAGEYSACHDAIQELYRTTPSSQQRSDLRHLEARALARMDRYNEARRIYIDLSRMSPGDADVWIELASVALQVGDERRLDQGSAHALRIAPDRHEGYLLRAVYEWDRGNFDQAERLFEQSIERADNTQLKDSHLPSLLLGRLYQSQGRADDAHAAYARALRIQPDSAEAQRLLAELSDRRALSSVPPE